MRFKDVGLKVISYSGDKDGFLGKDEGTFVLKTNIPLLNYGIYGDSAANLQYFIQPAGPSKGVEGEDAYVTECRVSCWGSNDNGIPTYKLKEGAILYSISCLEEKNFPVFFNIRQMLDEAEDYKKKIGKISDGYHTFDELYYYRMLYNAAFLNEYAKSHPDAVVKSRRHDDGELCFGGSWFIVQANLPTGQVSNHYEEKYWDLFKIPEADTAFEFDGHNPEIAAERLEKFLKL